MNWCWLHDAETNAARLIEPGFLTGVSDPAPRLSPGLHERARDALPENVEFAGNDAHHLRGRCYFLAGFEDDTARICTAS